jgi:preprotein translocase subunit SecF
MAASYGKKGFEIRRIEAVGPKAGKDLTQKGILAVCFSLLGMLIYISWRYEFRFALGGIIALIPVLFVLAWEPGSLVMFGIPLSVVNVSVASIILSSGIDYGIVITHGTDTMGYSTAAVSFAIQDLPVPVIFCRFSKKQ